MSRAAKRRRIIRWARYFNHYDHVPDVAIGGTAAVRIIWRGLFGAKQDYFLHVRRQAKHRSGEGRSS